MKRTELLRLQKPEPGDEYSSNTLTFNTQLIDKMLAEIGGNIPKRTVPIENVFKVRTGFSLDGGSFTVYGNGLAWLEINFTTTKSFSVDRTTGLIAGATLADVNPEFSTIIATPLYSGGIGPAVTGYIAPDTTRVVLRNLHGYFSGDIPVGTQMQLSGIYPLAERPQSIGLELMRATQFDYEVHNNNLQKIDKVAKKLKTNLKPTNAAISSLTPVGDISIVSRILHLNSKGMVTFSMTFTKRTYISGNSSGNLGNVIIANMYESWRPDRYVKLISATPGPLLHGEINPNTGNVSITANAGKGVIVPALTELNLCGSWPYNGS